MKLGRLSHRLEHLLFLGRMDSQLSADIKKNWGQVRHLVSKVWQLVVPLGFACWFPRACYNTGSTVQRVQDLADSVLLVEWRETRKRERKKERERERETGVSCSRGTLGTAFSIHRTFKHSPR